MATQTPYTIDAFVTVPEILALMKRVAAVYPKYTAFSPSELQYADFEAGAHLPPLTIPAGVNLPSLLVLANLPPIETPITCLTEMVKRMRKGLGRRGNVSFDIHYRRQGSNVASEECDESISFVQRSDALGFGYQVRPGSRLDHDRAAVSAFLQQALLEARLPLQVSPQDELGHQLLLPTQPLKFLHPQTLDIRETRTMAAFYCEVPGATVSDIIDRLYHVLALAHAAGPYPLSWVISLDENTFPEEAMDHRSRYERIRELQLPANEHTVSITYQLTDLSGLDALITFAGPRGRLTTEIGSFAFREHGEPEDNYAWLEVLTAKKGHRLRMRTRFEIEDLATINRKMGIEWQRAK